MRAYGATGSVIDCMIRFVNETKRTEVFDRWVWPSMPPDSEPGRARSLVASNFLHSGDDVLVMTDADVRFAEGDIEYVAAAALHTKGVAGGIVSKRAFGQGFGGRIPDGQRHELYSDEIIPLRDHMYLGGAVLALHRSVLVEIVKQGVVPYCPPQGYWPFFCQTWIKNEKMGCYEHLSEDWAFCHYARQAGKPVLALMRPVTSHEGSAQFTALEGNAFVEEEVSHE
jgi:hypothetical protein